MAVAVLTGHTAVVLWTEVAALLLVARLLGALAQRIGQPPVIGALAAGLLLGPSVFGVLWHGGFAWFLPHASISGTLLSTLAQFSLLMLLVVLGAQTDIGLMSSLGRQTSSVAVASIVVPFGAGIAVGLAAPGVLLGHSHSRVPFALLIAGAVSVSSLPVVARIVDELGLTRRNVGQIALGVAGINDVYGFLLIALGAALTGTGAASTRLALALGGIVVIGAGLAIAGQRLVDSVLRVVRARGPNVAGSLTVCVVAALFLAAASQALQIDAALGAFIAGIVLGRSRFQQSQALAHLESWTTAVFAPLYFSYAALQVDVTAFKSASVLVFFFVVVSVAAAAKFSGAFAGSLIGRMPVREATALGVALNGRGAMQVIIGSVGLGLGILSESAYSVVILMSVVTSILVPPLLGSCVRSWPGTATERERLEREEEMEQNVVVRGQRLLLPIAEGIDFVSAAEVLDRAWPGGCEVTALALDVPGSDRFSSRRNALEQELDGRPMRWLTRFAETEVHEEILAEANLGYGIVAVGVDAAEDGQILPSLVCELLNRSPIPVLLVRGSRRRKVPELVPRRFRKIVVPVTGTSTSRAGQEVAHNISRCTGAEVRLVHVLTRPSAAAEPALQSAQRAGDAVLGEAADTASRHDVDSARADMRVGRSSAEEVEALVEELDADLVVLGASVRRVGGRPFLGHTVEHLLEHVTGAEIVVVALPEVSTVAVHEHADRSIG